jgi:23S rRNA (cytosine1962-C5)-methyltransferase
MALPIVYVSHELGRQLRRGHPWVYRDSLSRDANLPSGTWVQVQCGRLQAYGLWDAHSAIAVRIFAWKDLPDAAWFAHAARRAWDLRLPLRRVGTTAYRWIYGEGDRVPGIVADLYGDYVVIQTYAEGLESVLDGLVKGLGACTHLKGISLRGDALTPLWGRNPPRDLVVEEHGMRFHANLYAGHKTGLYLDQRDNRRYVERWCGGKQVLNCFSYTGGFSLYAARGGCRQAISVDITPQLAEELDRNLALNGLDPEQYPFIAADCFELLERYADEGRLFDLIILDPPSLARSRKNKYAALRAYERLNKAAMRCLPDGGLLATSSCTAQVSPEDFRDVLADAAAGARKRLFVLHEAGHAIDHPVPAHFPEGRYLKFVLGQVEEIL